MKYYKFPACIERETDKAILDENFGWLPKSKIEITTEKDHNGVRWLTVPAWLVRNKGIPAYAMKNAIVEIR